jgi:TonB-linked SusC/RagA family outer membrane protein
MQKSLLLVKIPICRYNQTLRVTRITIFLLLVTVLNVNATGYSQDKLTLDLKNARLSLVFDIIQKKTPYHFLYNSEDVRDAPPVNISARNATVPEILESCFKNSPLEYRIESNVVVVMKRESRLSPTDARRAENKFNLRDPFGRERIEALKNVQTSFSVPPKMVVQKIVVSGRVTNETGQPLAGVSVGLKGNAMIGTNTNENGSYTISADDENETLIFSSVGYIAQEVEIKGRNVIDVVMQTSASSLQQVVVTALGLKRSKGSLTYSTQSVSPENMVQARSENILSGLSGKVAGINITSSANGVGSPAKVVLRGNRSINGSSQPLYVVDGLVLNGDISNISPDEIESISVLKGANAAALYGSRASNGAIIVTTKSGSRSAKGVSSSVGFNYTQNSALRLLQFQNEYGQGTNGIYSPAAINSWGPKMDGQMVNHWSNDPNYIANELNGATTYPFSPQPDNVWDFFRNGSVFNTNLSVNVKTENSNFFVNYTNTNSQGIVRGNDLKGHNLSVHATTDLSGKLRMETKLSYVRQNFSNVLPTSFSFQNPVYFLYQTGRNIRTADLQHYEFTSADGKQLQHFYSPNFNGAGNPYWTVNNELYPRILERVMGMVNLKYSFTDNLSLLVRSGLDRSNTTDETKLHNDTYITAPNGLYAKSANTSYEWNTDFLLNYNQKFLKDFRVDVNMGANSRVFKSNGLTSSGSNFLIPNLFALSNTTNPTTTDSYAEKNVNSVYAFAEISYKSAIYLNVTARNDWSSTLPVQNRSYFYPSIGSSIVLSNLITMPQAINYLKVNASFAKVGNDTDPYMLSRTATANNGAINLSTVLPNANLKPESIYSYEAGLDLGLVQDRVRLNFTYYKQNSFDQLFSSLVPPASGVSSLFQNGGNIQNKGVEINVGVTPVRGMNFSWDIDFNFAKNTSEVLEISENLNELAVGSADYMRIYKLVKGDPFGTVYTRGFVRDDNGNVIVDHLTGLPKTTPDMSTRAANFTPDWLGGINNSFRYKNFNLSFLIDMRKGGSFVSFSESILSGAGVLDYTAVGRDGSLIFGENVYGYLPTITDDGSKNTVAVSAQDLWTKLGGLGAPVGEAFIRSASNVRLRELIFGYSLPEKLFSKNNFFKAARISLVGRNLFFISNKAKNIDPEIVTNTSNSAEGLESLALPTTRSAGISLKVDF